MKNIIYSGSFDPLTFGHLDIIKRASQLGRVHVLVAVNSSKKSLIPNEKKVSLIEESLASMGLDVIVTFSEDATVDYLDQVNDAVLIRGVRDGLDWHMESRLDLMNRGINLNAETIFLQASPEFQHVSSSYAKELFRLSKPLEKVCPQPIIKFLSEI